MSEGPRGPFVPLPMHPGAAPPPSPGRDGTPAREVRVVYVSYRDPNPLEFPDRAERFAGPVFHAAGVLLREDEEFLALGEVAFAEENPSLVQRYGRDLFPAYRHVLTIPKATIVQRREMTLGGPIDPAKPSPDGFGQT